MKKYLKLSLYWTGCPGKTSHNTLHRENIFASQPELQANFYPTPNVVCKIMTPPKDQRRSNPENMFLKVPFYIPSVHKSKVHFNKSFSYDAPKLWNDLPLEIWTAPTLSCFKRRLKTYLFQKSFPPYVFSLPNTDDPLVTTWWFMYYDLDGMP